MDTDGCHINPKYLDTLTIYHTCPKIWSSPFCYLLLCLKYIARWVANSVDPDQRQHSVASDLVLLCLHSLFVPILSLITIFWRCVLFAALFTNDLNLLLFLVFPFIFITKYEGVIFNPGPADPGYTLTLQTV